MSKRIVVKQAPVHRIIQTLKRPVLLVDQNPRSPFSDLTSIPPDRFFDETVTDRLLLQYATVVVNHAESAAADLCLAFVKWIQNQRPDLDLVILTGNATCVPKYERYFSATVAKVSSHGPKCEVVYLAQPCSDLVQATAQAIARLGTKRMAVFGDRRQVTTELTRRGIDLSHCDYEHDQSDARLVFFERVFDDDVPMAFDYVVDSGLEAGRPISPYQAEVRRRMAVADGLCLRMYPEEVGLALRPAQVDWTQLGSVLLHLLDCGINVATFDYIERPPDAVLADALSQLLALDAIDSHAALTSQGRLMTSMPVPARWARALAAAVPRRCVLSVLATACCCMSGGLSQMLVFGKPDAHRQHSRFRVQQGDHATMYNVFWAYSRLRSDRGRWCRELFVSEAMLRQALDRYKKLLKCLAVKGQGEGDARDMAHCLAVGFYDQVVQNRPGGPCRLTGEAVTVDRDSVLHEVDWAFAVYTGSQVRDCTVLTVEDLAAHYATR